MKHVSILTYSIIFNNHLRCWCMWKKGEKGIFYRKNFTKEDLVRYSIQLAQEDAPSKVVIHDLFGKIIDIHTIKESFRKLQ